MGSSRCSVLHHVNLRFLRSFRHVEYCELSAKERRSLPDLNVGKKITGVPVRELGTVRVVAAEASRVVARWCGDKMWSTGKNLLEKKFPPQNV